MAKECLFADIVDFKFEMVLLIIEHDSIELERMREIIIDISIVHQDISNMWQFVVSNVG